MAPGRGSAARGFEVSAFCAAGRGSPAGPPPPVAAPPTSWLRAPSRGDPPLKLLAVRGGLPVRRIQKSVDLVGSRWITSSLSRVPPWRAQRARLRTPHHPQREVRPLA